MRSTGLPFGLPTYDEIRRNGWPRQRKIVDAVEAYLRQSRRIVAPEISAAGVAAIVNDSAIRRSLTEWTGFTQAYYRSLGCQNDAAKQALALIDAELAKER